MTSPPATPSTLGQRFVAPRTGQAPRDAAPGWLLMRTGSLRDYEMIASHHYRAARPATATRVLTLVNPTPTPAQRFRREPGVTCNESCSGSIGEVVAVLVESLPSLSCRLRDFALGDRYGAVRDLSQRARLLNDEVRCISRVVVDPRWRGLGLAVWLVRTALATATTPVTEALAAMGHVHPFFERAGMTAHRRPAHTTDARLLAALEHAGLGAISLADLGVTMRHIAALPSGQRTWLAREARRWHQHTTRRRDTPDLRATLAFARTRLWCEPVYYVRSSFDTNS